MREPSREHPFSSGDDLHHVSSVYSEKYQGCRAMLIKSISAHLLQPTNPSLPGWRGMLRALLLQPCKKTIKRTEKVNEVLITIDLQYITQ